MNDQQLNNLVAEAIGLDEWVITKNGYYYRPDACGYTSNLAEAWKVPLETAKKYEMYADNPRVPFCEKVLIQKAPDPDFGEDLNETRKMETFLMRDENALFLNLYENELYRHCNLKNYLDSGKTSELFSWNAKASTRRKCFLKALKLI